MKNIRKGFTLIELLVVIGIIALLASILGPKVADIYKQAQVTKCAANVKAIGTGMAAYKSANSNRVPYFDINKGEANKSTEKYEDPVADCNADAKAQEYDSTASATEKSKALKDYMKENRKCNLAFWYLLIYRENCEAKHFQCPSDDEYAAIEDPANTIGFEKWTNVSYGLQPLTANKWSSAFSARQKDEKVCISDKPEVGLGETLDTSDLGKSSPNRNHGWKACNISGGTGGAVEAMKWSDESENKIKFKKAETAMANAFGFGHDDIFNYGEKGSKKAKAKTSTVSNPDTDASLTIFSAPSPNDSYCFWRNDD